MVLNRNRPLTKVTVSGGSTVYSLYIYMERHAYTSNFRVYNTRHIPRYSNAIVYAWVFRQIVFLLFVSGKFVIENHILFAQEAKMHVLTNGELDHSFFWAEHNDVQHTKRALMQFVGNTAPDQCLRCPLTQSLDTVVYVDEQRMTRSDCTDGQAHLDLRFWHMA